MVHDWVEKDSYPFQARYFETDSGRMHYLDEGKGEPLVFVHGTPVWSYVYRPLISALSAHYRCIAIDLLGFGLSDKPKQADYSPPAHAQRLEVLLESLQLDTITLIAHDYGGPIGLSYLFKHSVKVKQVILFNSWMWSLQDYPEFVKTGKIASSVFGKWLYRYFNFAPKVLIRQAFNDQSKLSKTSLQHYINAFPDASSRSGPLVLAQHLIASNAWFDALWEKRRRLSEKPILILWGNKDLLLNLHMLNRWKTTFPEAQVVEIESGHFVQEEKPEEVFTHIYAFLKGTENAKDE